MTAELDSRAPRLRAGATVAGWAWGLRAAAAAMAGKFDEARAAAQVVVEGGFLGQPLILGAGVQAMMELYHGETERAAGMARLSISIADTALEADLPVCAPALFVLAHDQDPVHAARALARLRQLQSDAPSPYMDVLVQVAEIIQDARSGLHDAEPNGPRAEDVVGAEMEGVPGMALYVAKLEARVAGAGGMRPIDDRLSAAELNVLSLMARQLTRRQIGQALGISLNTVKFHARSVLRKLGAATTVDAVERARGLGLLTEIADDPGPPPDGA